MGLGDGAASARDALVRVMEVLLVMQMVLPGRGWRYGLDFWINFRMCRVIFYFDERNNFFVHLFFVVQLRSVSQVYGSV